MSNRQWLNLSERIYTLYAYMIAIRMRVDRQNNNELCGCVVIVMYVVHQFTTKTLVLIADSALLLYRRRVYLFMLSPIGRSYIQTQMPPLAGSWEMVK